MVQTGSNLSQAINQLGSATNAKLQNNEIAMIVDMQSGASIGQNLDATTLATIRATQAELPAGQHLYLALLNGDGTQTLYKIDPAQLAKATSLDEIGEVIARDLTPEELYAKSIATMNADPDNKVVAYFQNRTRATNFKPSSGDPPKTVISEVLALGDVDTFIKDTTFQTAGRLRGYAASPYSLFLSGTTENLTPSQAVSRALANQARVTGEEATARVIADITTNQSRGIVNALRTAGNNNPSFLAELSQFERQISEAGLAFPTTPIKQDTIQVLFDEYQTSLSRNRAILERARLAGINPKVINDLSARYSLNNPLTLSDFHATLSGSLKPSHGFSARNTLIANLNEIGNTLPSSYSRGSRNTMALADIARSLTPASPTRAPASGLATRLGRSLRQTTSNIFSATRALTTRLASTLTRRQLSAPSYTPTLSIPTSSGTTQQFAIIDLLRDPSFNSLIFTLNNGHTVDVTSLRNNPSELFNFLPSPAQVRSIRYNGVNLPASSFQESVTAPVINASTPLLTRARNFLAPLGNRLQTLTTALAARTHSLSASLRARITPPTTTATINSSPVDQATTTLLRSFATRQENVFNPTTLTFPRGVDINTGKFSARVYFSSLIRTNTPWHRVNFILSDLASGRTNLATATTQIQALNLDQARRDLIVNSIATTYPASVAPAQPTKTLIAPNAPPVTPTSPTPLIQLSAGSTILNIDLTQPIRLQTIVEVSDQLSTSGDMSPQIFQTKEELIASIAIDQQNVTEAVTRNNADKLQTTRAVVIISYTDHSGKTQVSNIPYAQPVNQISPTNQVSTPNTDHWIEYFQNQIDNYSNTSSTPKFQSFLDRLTQLKAKNIDISPIDTSTDTFLDETKIESAIKVAENSANPPTPWQQFTDWISGRQTNIILNPQGVDFLAGLIDRGLTLGKQILNFFRPQNTTPPISQPTPEQFTSIVNANLVAGTASQNNYLTIATSLGIMKRDGDQLTFDLVEQLNSNHTISTDFAVYVAQQAPNTLNILRTYLEYLGRNQELQTTQQQILINQLLNPQTKAFFDLQGNPTNFEGFLKDSYQGIVDDIHIEMQAVEPEIKSHLAQDHIYHQFGQQLFTKYAEYLSLADDEKIKLASDTLNLDYLKTGLQIPHIIIEANGHTIRVPIILSHGSNIGGAAVSQPFSINNKDWHVIFVQDALGSKGIIDQLASVSHEIDHAVRVTGEESLKNQLVDEESKSSAQVFDAVQQHLDTFSRSEQDAIIQSMKLVNQENWSQLSEELTFETIMHEMGGESASSRFLQSLSRGFTKQGNNKLSQRLILRDNFIKLMREEIINDSVGHDYAIAKTLGTALTQAFGDHELIRIIHSLSLEEQNLLLGESVKAVETTLLANQSGTKNFLDKLQLDAIFESPTVQSPIDQSDVPLAAPSQTTTTQPNLWTRFVSWIKSLNISEQGQLGIPLPGLFSKQSPPTNKLSENGQAIFDHYANNPNYGQLPKTIKLHKQIDEYYSFQQELIEAAKNHTLSNQFIVDLMKKLAKTGNVKFKLASAEDIFNTSGGVAYCQAESDPQTNVKISTVYFAKPSDYAKYLNITEEEAIEQLGYIIGHEVGHAYDHETFSAYGIDPESSEGLWATELLQYQFVVAYNSARGWNSPGKQAFIDHILANSKVDVVSTSVSSPLTFPAQTAANALDVFLGRTSGISAFPDFGSLLTQFGQNTATWLKQKWGDLTGNTQQNQITQSATSLPQQFLELGINLTQNHEGDWYLRIPSSALNRLTTDTTIDSTTPQDTYAYPINLDREEISLDNTIFIVHLDANRTPRFETLNSNKSKLTQDETLFLTDNFDTADIDDLERLTSKLISNMPYTAPAEQNIYWSILRKISSNPETAKILLYQAFDADISLRTKILQFFNEPVNHQSLEQFTKFIYNNLFNTNAQQQTELEASALRLHQYNLAPDPLKYLEIELKNKMSAYLENLLGQENYHQARIASLNSSLPPTFNPLPQDSPDLDPTKLSTYNTFSAKINTINNFVRKQDPDTIAIIRRLLREIDPSVDKQIDQVINDLSQGKTSPLIESYLRLGKSGNNLFLPGFDELSLPYTWAIFGELALENALSRQLIPPAAFSIHAQEMRTFWQNNQVSEYFTLTPDDIFYKLYDPKHLSYAAHAGGFVSLISQVTQSDDFVVLLNHEALHQFILPTTNNPYAEISTELLAQIIHLGGQLPPPNFQNSLYQPGINQIINIIEQINQASDNDIGLSLFIRGVIEYKGEKIPHPLYHLRSFYESIVTTNPHIFPTLLEKYSDNVFYKEINDIQNQTSTIPPALSTIPAQRMARSVDTNLSPSLNTQLVDLGKSAADPILTFVETRTPWQQFMDWLLGRTYGFVQNAQAINWMTELPGNIVRRLTGQSATRVPLPLDTSSWESAEQTYIQSVTAKAPQLSSIYADPSSLLPSITSDINKYVDITQTAFTPISPSLSLTDATSILRNQARAEINRLFNNSTKRVNADKVKILNDYTDNYLSYLTQAIDEEGLDLDINSIQSLLMSNIHTLAYQDYVASTNLLGDHGLRHLVEHNTTVTLNLLDKAKKQGVPLRAIHFLAAMEAQTNHDAGYAVQLVREGIDQGKFGIDIGHNAVAAQILRDKLADPNHPLRQVYSPDILALIHRGILHHDSSFVDMTSSAESAFESAIHIADNTHAFETKLPELLFGYPESLRALRLLKAVGETMNKGEQAELIAQIKADLIRSIESHPTLGADDKIALVKAAQLLDPIQYKFNVGRISGNNPIFEVIDGKIVITAEISEIHRQMIQLFGQEAYLQLAKFIADITGVAKKEEILARMAAGELSFGNDKITVQAILSPEEVKTGKSPYQRNIEAINDTAFASYNLQDNALASQQKLAELDLVKTPNNLALQAQAADYKSRRLLLLKQYLTSLTTDNHQRILESVKSITVSLSTNTPQVTYTVFGNKLVSGRSGKAFTLAALLKSIPEGSILTTDKGNSYILQVGNLLSHAPEYKVMETTPFTVVMANAPLVDITNQYHRDPNGFYGSDQTLIRPENYSQIEFNPITGFPQTTESLTGTLSIGEEVLIMGSYKPSPDVTEERLLDVSNVLGQLNLQGHSVTQVDMKPNSKVSNLVNIMTFGLRTGKLGDKYIPLLATGSFGISNSADENVAKYFKGYAAFLDPRMPKPIAVIPDLETTAAPPNHLLFIVPDVQTKNAILKGLGKDPHIDQTKLIEYNIHNRIFTHEEVLNGSLERALATSSLR